MPNYSPIQQSKVIVVATIENAAHALPIAEALLAADINHIEVTLRSEAALKAISAIAKQLPDMQVGAGTVLSEQQLLSARDAGAKFCFSPGFEANLAKRAIDEKIIYVPGVASASEVQQALALGLNTLKLFPAACCGGEKLLKALYAPFPQALFCPTGGVRLDNMSDYLALPNVFAVGGSWLVTKDIVEKQQWSEITNLAKQAIEEYDKCRS